MSISLNRFLSLSPRHGSPSVQQSDFLDGEDLKNINPTLERSGTNVGPSRTRSTNSGGAKTNQALYLTPANLTFPGVTVVAGAILGFWGQNIGGNRLWVAAIIAVVFGLFITIMGLTDKNTVIVTTQDKVIAVFTGLVNTVLLWISIFGVSAVPTVLAAANQTGH